MTLRVREAEPGDLAAITDLVGQLGYPSAEAAVAGRLERLADDAKSWVFVAVQDGRVVGLAAVHVMSILERDDPIARVTAMVVDESMRGGGVGTRWSTGSRRLLDRRTATRST